MMETALDALVATEGFRSPVWLAGGHRQTLLGYCLRRSLRFSLPSEDLVVEAGEGVQLLLRASWQPEPRMFIRITCQPRACAKRPVETT